MYMDLEDDDNTIFYGQGSGIWHALYKKSMLTGSTMFMAFGFHSLKAEKEHVNVHIKGIPAPDYSPEMQGYLEFGSHNEINAIATLVYLIMPALLPSCQYFFFEVGPNCINGTQESHFIKVSAEGKYRTHNKIAVEAKCLFPSDDVHKFPYYKVPIYYVQQLLCELVAYKADE